MISFLPESPAVHGAAIERLFDSTFGPGHFAKTAERVREFSASLPDISRVGILDGKVIAVCRVWPIAIGETPCLFYGPIAVHPDHQGTSIGRQVTEASLQAGRASDYGFACLIGAPSYFSRMGFEVAPKGSVRMPGPQDPARVMLARLSSDETVEYPTGPVTFPRDARRAEATQIEYLQRARLAE